MKVLASALMVVLALTLPVSSQTQTQVPKPTRDDPDVSTGKTEDAGDGTAHWNDDINYPADKNYASGDAFDYRWKLWLDTNGSAPGYVDDKGKTWYGLFVQRVFTVAAGSSCDGEFSFFNMFTYYEWSWVTNPPMHGLSDVFGTGHWDTSAGNAERGYIFKLGTAKFVPLTAEDIQKWANGETPPAIEAGNGFHDNADGDWNTTTGSDDNVPVNDENGDQEAASPSSGAHSGKWPNSREKPDGWDDDFGHSETKTITRFLFVVWDYCSEETEPPKIEIPQEF